MNGHRRYVLHDQARVLLRTFGLMPADVPELSVIGTIRVIERL